MLENSYAFLSEESSQATSQSLSTLSQQVSMLNALSQKRSTETA